MTVLNGRFCLSTQIIIFVHLGDKESHCVILYSGEIVEIKNIYEGSSGNNNTTQLRKHHKGPVVFGVGALMLPETRSSCIQVSSLEGAETYMLHQKTFQKFWQETSKLSYKTILNSLQHFHFFTCLGALPPPLFLTHQSHANIIMVWFQL